VNSATEVGKNANRISCTIAIPVYNRQDFIRRAVDSALEQDVPDLEILVADNCSTDHTWDVLQSYADSRLRLVRNERNVGLFGNFNRCLSLARGEYLRFLCSDDKLVPGCLSREIEIMGQHSNVSLLSTRNRLVNEKGHRLREGANLLRPGIYRSDQAVLAVLWSIAHYALNPLNYPSGVLLRRAAALRADRFDTTLRMLGDVDYFLRVLDYGDLAVVDTVGCEITIHEGMESVRVASDGVRDSEFLMLVERYRVQLEQESTYKRILQQVAAHATGVALKYWYRRMSQASEQHLKIAYSTGTGCSGIVVGIARLIGLRLLLKIAGIRPTPIRAAQPLTDTIGPEAGGACDR